MEKQKIEAQTNENGAQMRKMSPETKRAAALFRKLSPADRQLIISLLRSLSSMKE